MEELYNTCAANIKSCVAFLMNVSNMLHFLWAINLLELTKSLCVLKAKVPGGLGVSQGE